MYLSRKIIAKTVALIILLIIIVYGLSIYKTFKKQVIDAYPYHQAVDIPSIKSYPIDLINMVLAVEDQRFLQHNGMDFIQIFNAIKDYLFNNKPLRGASTISQQLIKNGLLSTQRTYQRKLNEALMTFILENNFSKIQILEAYLNIVYLGQSKNGGVYGFSQASLFYFNKPMDELNLDEMAELVALLKGASYYHPVHYKDRLDKRKKLVSQIFKQYQQYHGQYTSN